MSVTDEVGVGPRGKLVGMADSEGDRKAAATGDVLNTGVRSGMANDKEPDTVGSNVTTGLDKRCKAVPRGCCCSGDALSVDGRSTVLDANDQCPDAAAGASNDKSGGNNGVGERS